jgi:cobalt-zinc-cadmium efflux system outer membrane protein
MRRRCLVLFALVLGCRTGLLTCGRAAAWPSPEPPPTAPTLSALFPAQPLDLGALWNLARTHHPALREAEAEVGAAQGRLLQAHKYPNPQFTYEEEALGTHQAAAGNVRLSVSQTIVTGGKRRLDVAIARKGTEVAGVALTLRHFAVLTSIRRAYSDYLGLLSTLQVYDAAAKNLQQAVDVTRKLVEQAKTRPRSDLLRLEALLADAQLNQERTRINAFAAWRQLAAEAGVPDLPVPAAVVDFPAAVPCWPAETVLARVLQVNAELQQAARETEQARLQVQRAQAEAVPDITVGGGYNRNFAENEAGAIISLQTALPLWDRKQGLILEAHSKLARAQAAQQNLVNRLHRDTVEAYARYQGASRQADRLTREVLPRAEESLDLVRKGYEAGSAQVTFADVLLAQDTLNETRLRLVQGRRDLWRAVADLQGLMQLGLDEDLASGGCQPPVGHTPLVPDPGTPFRRTGL